MMGPVVVVMGEWLYVCWSRGNCLGVVFSDLEFGEGEESFLENSGRNDLVCTRMITLRTSTVETWLEKPKQSSGRLLSPDTQAVPKKFKQSPELCPSRKHSTAWAKGLVGRLKCREAVKAA